MTSGGVRALPNGPTSRAACRASRITISREFRVILASIRLTDIETIRKQAALAQAAGVYGFVFYYYWFNGKRLLERPLEHFLKDRDINMPFCLMWANENWTRRWDGMEGEVLISQDYLPNDDDRLLADFNRHFKDPRYIRIQGRPLLMIYRPRLIPDTANVIATMALDFREEVQGKSDYHHEPEL